MNYIGSKYSLLDFLYSTIKEVTKYEDGSRHTFADLFAGTGVVGAYYRNLGHNVLSNDLQYYSYAVNRHQIKNTNSVRKDLLEYLNALPGVDGFVYNNYCAGSGSGRNYFTDSNGRKCDAIRIELEKMLNAKEIDEDTYFYYLASLINSIDKFANTASVYGAFLKTIKKSAARDFVLTPLPVVNGPKGTVYNKDVNELIPEITGDILYLDPPYNNRQFCTNYHVLETIAKYDAPVIRGVTGLRDYTYQKSAFCSSKTVFNAFESLIKQARFKYIFLSYNNEGLMSVEQIKDIMSRYGEYSVYTRSYRRFKADKDSNRNISANKTVEYLHCLVKNDV